jgi:hypothetical protein
MTVQPLTPRVLVTLAVGAVLLASSAACSSNETGGTGGQAGVGAQAGAAGAAGSLACGNDVTEPGEACDGSDLGLATSSCSSLPGFTSGTLVCRADCSGFDVTGCSAGTVQPVVTTGGAPSCEELDVQRTIDAATDGDTVEMAAGSCTWAGLLRDGVPDAPLLLASKNLVLRGAGAGSTVITRSYPGTNNDNRQTIAVEADEPFRITGFTLQSTLALDGVYGIAVYGAGKPWRIDHLEIVGLSATELSAVGEMRGLIDHVELRDNGGVGVEVDDVEPTDDGIDGTTSWSRPLSLGTANAVYVEDCTITRSDPALTGFGEDVASNRGSRYVVRHTTFTNTISNVFVGQLDAHGNCNAQARGSRSYEVYDNDFTVTGSDSTTKIMAVRGGDGVGFGNHFSYAGGAPFFLREYRADTSTCDQCAPFGDTPGCLGPNDYPAPDQTREGYFWDNTLDGAAVGAEVAAEDYNSLYLVEGRDYFNAPRPGYVPYVYPHPLVQLGD